MSRIITKLCSVLSSFAMFMRASLSNVRSYAAVISTGISSITNFIISISIASSASVDTVAEFAIAFAAFLAISGITRAMVSEPSAARLLSNQDLRRAGQQVSFYGMVFSIPIVLVGLVTDQIFLSLVGSFSHAIAMQDFSKFVSIAFGRSIISVYQELLKFVTVIIAISIPQLANDPVVLLLAWLLATAVVGYAGAGVQRIRVIPALSNKPVPLKESVSYGLDYIMGSGTTQITTFVLGGMASPSVNASLRGGGTLLGPITMVATSTRALIIPFLSRRLRSSGGAAPAVNVAAALMLVAIPFALVVNLIPHELGEALLGDTWHLTKVILPTLSLELLFSLLANVPFAGHRSLGAHRRTLVIRSIFAPFRITMVVIAGITGGFVWAAFAMLLVSIIGAITWWVSYVSLIQKGKAK